jgi:prepilin-type N-terminal cleavage/methylation domain-containing protein
LLFKFFL